MFDRLIYFYLSEYITRKKRDMCFEITAHIMLMSRSTCEFSVSYSIILLKSAQTCPTTIMAIFNYFYKILFNDL